MYEQRRDLLLYDVATDKVTRLKRGLSLGRAPQPRFLDYRTISFRNKRQKDTVNPFGRDSLYEIDVPTRRVVEVLRLPTDIHAYAWNPDRTLLAYEVSIPFIDDKGSVQPTGGLAVCLYDATTGATRLIRELGGFVIGTDCCEEDETVLMWSPSGASILIVDTIKSEKNIFVIDREGRDRVRPRVGTFGFWINDHTVAFREMGGFHLGKPARGKWFLLDLRSDQTRTLHMRSGSRPVLSPAGRWIAFDDADTRGPSTYVFDLRTGESKRLAEDYGAPIWLTAEEIAVTAGGPCPPRTECEDWWTPLDRTIAVNVRSGLTRRLALGTTGPFPFSEVNADVLLAQEN